MARALELIVESELSPRRSLAADGFLLDEVSGARRPALGALRIFRLGGEALCLGRYHRAPEPRSDVRVGLWRRHSGGRAVPTGAGFLGLSLVLPHRSALVATEPLALDPAQVLNRHVRGMLEACKLAGVSAFYPGRDAVTVNGRILALVSFEVDEGGACLVEAIIACGRDFSALPAFLDAADPGGVVRAAMLTPEDTTSLARELGREPVVAEMVEWLRRGHEARLDVRFTPREFTAGEVRAIETEAGSAYGDERWLRQRRVRADLDRHAALAGQLGTVEIDFAIVDGCLHDVALVGDFIAPSPTVERLEATLRGCRAERRAIEARVAAVLAEPGSFLLGLGPPRAVAQAIGESLAS